MKIITQQFAGLADQPHRDVIRVHLVRQKGILNTCFISEHDDEDDDDDGVGDDKDMVIVTPCSVCLQKYNIVSNGCPGKLIQEK